MAASENQNQGILRTFLALVAIFFLLGLLRELNYIFVPLAVALLLYFLFPSVD